MPYKSIEKNRQYDVDYQRQRRKNNKGLKTKEYRIYCDKNPEKVKAHRILREAVRTGKIKRLPCKVCGENRKYRVHAHHDDYSKPLSVKWLCGVHHKIAHSVAPKNKKQK